MPRMQDPPPEVERAQPETRGVDRWEMLRRKLRPSAARVLPGASTSTRVGQTALDTWIWLAHQAKRPETSRSMPTSGAEEGPTFQSYRPRIPTRKHWPKSFDGGNGVSGWADQWVQFKGFKDLLEFQGFTLVNMAPLAWWHDLWYHLGYFVPWDTPWKDLVKLKPRPRSERNWIQRRACDKHFRVGVLYMGFPLWRAKAAWKVLNKLGAPYYFYGGPNWTHHC